MEKTGPAWKVKKRLIELHLLRGLGIKALRDILDGPRVSRLIRNAEARPPDFRLSTVEGFARHFGMTFDEFMGMPPPEKHGRDDLIRDLNIVLSHAGSERIDGEIAIIEATIRAAAGHLLQEKESG